MGWIGASVVAMCTLHALVSLLRFDGQGGDWPSFEAADADRFVSLFAIAVGSVVDPVKRRVDLGDQPAAAGLASTTASVENIRPEGDS